MKLFEQAILVRDIAYDVQFVMNRVELQLVPHVEQEEQRVVRVLCQEGVAELETVLLEGEHLQLLLVEIAVEFVTIARVAALMQVTPNGSHRHDDLHGREVVINHELQVSVHGEHSHGIQVGQHIEEHAILLVAGESVVVEFFHLILIEHLDRHHQHR